MNLHLYKKLQTRYIRASDQDVLSEAGRIRAGRSSRHGPRPTLSADDVADIKRRRSDGETLAHVARVYGVSEALISKVTRRG